MPWATLVLSVVLYIVVPVIIAQLLRRRLLATGGQAALDRLLATLQPLSLVALLATLVLLFGFQGEQIIAQPAIIALLAVPILIQVYFNSGLAYLLNRLAGEQHCVAGPSALIGASNFFELAVAAAISLFGFHSGAALATVVGVLIEVPVMLSVVWIVNHSKGWYERGARVRRPRGKACAMTITIYHNPACGTSRNTLAMIRESGEEPDRHRVPGTPAEPRAPGRADRGDADARAGAAAREGHALCRARPRRPEMDRRRAARLHAGASDPDQPADRRDAAGHAPVPAVGGGARPARQPDAASSPRKTATS